MDVLGKFVAVTMLVIAIFVVVPLEISNMHDETIQERVKTLTAKFSDEVREQGKITPSMYETYINQLDATGYLYNVDMVYTKNIVTPGKAIESEDEDSDITFYDTERTEESYYTADIVAGIYDGGANGKVIDSVADGEVHFNAGDHFSISVSSKSKTMFDKLAEIVHVRTSSAPRIETHAGGEIRDENW